MAHNSSQEQKGFFDSLIDNAKSAGAVVVDGVGKVSHMAVDGVKSAGTAVGDVAGKAVDVGKSGVSSVGGKAGGFIPSISVLPGLAKDLSLTEIIAREEAVTKLERQCASQEYSCGLREQSHEIISAAATSK